MERNILYQYKQFILSYVQLRQTNADFFIPYTAENRLVSAVCLITLDNKSKKRRDRRVGQRVGYGEARSRKTQ